MKPAPLLALLCSVLLSAQPRPADGRPRAFPGLTLQAQTGNLQGQLQTQRLEEVLLRAATGNPNSPLAPSDLLRDNILELLHPYPHLRMRQSAEDSGEEALRMGLLKRSDDPPLSIDLTFHLLRNMIQMAKMENQRAQAHINRKVLDEVGK